MKYNRRNSTSSDEVIIKEAMRQMMRAPSSSDKVPVREVSYISNDYLKKLRSKPFMVDETNKSSLSLEELRTRGSLLDRKDIILRAARFCCYFLT
ncbi:MAG: hypothetical protein MK137_09905 [Rickettsiales bacterium]|nr:hypothetical protein [Rickettsiales bacterium]